MISSRCCRDRAEDTLIIVERLDAAGADQSVQFSFAKRYIVLVPQPTSFAI
jgi:hypothetical protein